MGKSTMICLVQKEFLESFKNKLRRWYLPSLTRVSLILGPVFFTSKRCIYDRIDLVNFDLKYLQGGNTH
jgi:hypothetical protein